MKQKWSKNAKMPKTKPKHVRNTKMSKCQKCQKNAKYPKNTQNAQKNKNAKNVKMPTKKQISKSEINNVLTISCVCVCPLGPSGP